jgi:hypothetical protein
VMYNYFEIVELVGEHSIVHGCEYRGCYTGEDKIDLLRKKILKLFNV